MNRWLLHRLVKPLIFGLMLVPLAWLTYSIVTDNLGANPAQALVRALGDWTLRCLCLVLAVTPVRAMTGWTALARWRRMLGLFVFFYACLHLTAYAWLDMGMDFAEIGGDIAKRPFILVGFVAVLLLSAMALTSFDRAVRWLGGKRWLALHRTVYAVAGLSVLHFFWVRSAKNDFSEVFVYAAILAFLLTWRLAKFLRKSG